MKGPANATVSILRGTTTDAYGDTVDVATAVATGITASIIEQRHLSTNPVDGTVRQVRYVTGRVPAGTDVRVGDRLKDEATLVVYIVDGAPHQPGNAMRTNDIRLDLRRIT